MKLQIEDHDLKMNEVLLYCNVIICKKRVFLKNTHYLQPNLLFISSNFSLIILPFICSLSDSIPSSHIFTRWMKINDHQDRNIEIPYSKDMRLIRLNEINISYMNIIF